MLLGVIISFVLHVLVILRKLNYNYVLKDIFGVLWTLYLSLVFLFSVF